MPPRCKRLMIALMLLPLAGCVKLGSKPPELLVGLTSENTLPSGVARSVRDNEALAVAIPTAPKSLLVNRIAVLTKDGGYAYMKKAQWADTPMRLFRDLLAETIEARTSFYVPDVRSPLLVPGALLGGRLEAFGYDAAKKEVLVRFDASLRRAGRDTLDVQRFEARLPLRSDDADDVTKALNKAANQVAVAVSDWVAGATAAK